MASSAQRGGGGVGVGELGQIQITEVPTGSELDHRARPGPSVSHERRDPGRSVRLQPDSGRSAVCLGPVKLDRTPGDQVVSLSQLAKVCSGAVDLHEHARQVGQVRSAHQGRDPVSEKVPCVGPAFVHGPAGLADLVMAPYRNQQQPVVEPHGQAEVAQYVHRALVECGGEPIRGHPQRCRCGGQRVPAPGEKQLGDGPRARARGGQVEQAVHRRVRPVIYCLEQFGQIRLRGIRDDARGQLACAGVTVRTVRRLDI
jgi:hypothetical protein